MAKDAIKTLERLVYIYPMGEELHQKLGDLYLAQNSPEGAVREYSAVVAAKPMDRRGLSLQSCPCAAKRETARRREGAVVALARSRARIQAGAEDVARTFTLRNPAEE